MKYSVPERILLLTMIIFIAGSCKKEDPVHNYFQYELIKYEVDEGMIEYYGKIPPDAEGENFDVTLFSTGIVFDPMLGTFSGTGNYIYLEMFSSSSTGLASGVYTFDSEQLHDPGTFDVGTFGLFLNMDNQTGTAVLVNSGTVKVVRDGSSYKFEFNCNTSSGKSITGSFTGPLTFFDLTSTEK